MPDPALFLAGEAVIVVGSDAARIGDLAGQLATAGRRVAAFVGDPDDPLVASAVNELAKEQFGFAPQIVNQSNISGDLR